MIFTKLSQCLFLRGGTRKGPTFYFFFFTTSTLLEILIYTNIFTIKKH